MGDRCHIRLELRGCIKSADDLEAIAEAIIEERLTYELEEQENPTVSHIYAVMAEALANGENPSFTDPECNYANIDDVETVLQLAKVGYLVVHQAGGDYPAGSKSWSPELGMSEAISDGEFVVVTLADLISAHRKGEIDALIARTSQAEGVGLPRFSIAGDAERVIALVHAKQALQVG